MATHTVHNVRGQEIQDPPIARFLFNDTRMAPLWLIVRILLGLQWLGSGWGKITNPAWMETGEALKGFWTNAVAIPETGKPPIAFDWYRSFIQGMLDSGSYVWFAKLSTSVESVRKSSVESVIKSSDGKSHNHQSRCHLNISHSHLLL